MWWRMYFCKRYQIIMKKNILLKYKLLAVFFIFPSVYSQSQNMISRGILSQVYFIKAGANTGTCFAVSIEDNDYLVTAKHLFSDTLINKSKVNVSIFKDDRWINFDVVYLCHQNSNIDIAVLDLKSNDLKGNDFLIGGDEYYLSQDCFFLGFPFGMKMEDNKAVMNRGFPLPFVKKGIISGFMVEPNIMTQIFLDGHNNPGFSGGPVVIVNNAEVDERKIKIIGVVSAYLNDSKVIRTPMGDFINNENSGIVLSYGFIHVNEIIKANK